MEFHNKANAQAKRISKYQKPRIMSRSIIPMLWKTIAAQFVKEFRNWQVGFPLLWNSIASRAIRACSCLMLLTVLFIWHSPVSADHGPATTGAGFLLPSAEIIPANHADLSIRWQNMNYSSPAESDLRSATIRMGRVGDHFDAIGNGELASFSLGISISDHWDITFHGGWYTARNIRIGIIDGRGDYKLVDAGGISGFTDPGVSGRYQFFKNSFLKLTMLGGLTAPLGLSTNEDDYRDLNDLPILTAIQSSIQPGTGYSQQNGISTHLKPGTELDLGGGEFGLEPTMTPGQKTWSFSAGIATRLSFAKQKAISLSFRYTDWLTNKEMRPGRRIELGAGFPTFRWQDISLQYSLLYRFRDRSRSSDTILNNSGGQEIFSAFDFSYIFDEDISVGSGIAFPVWQINNGPQQSLGLLFSLNAGVRLHFEK